MKELLERYGSIDNIPEDEFTEDKRIKFIEENSNNLSLIPEKLRTEKVCWTALKDPSFNNLKLFPKELLKNGLANDIVAFSSRLISKIPKEFLIYISYDTYLNVVRENGVLLRYVPGDTIDYKMCEEALAAPNGHLVRIAFIPPRLFNQPLCEKLSLVSTETNFLRIVYKKNKELLSPEICANVISRFAEACFCVPDDMIEKTRNLLPLDYLTKEAKYIEGLHGYSHPYTKGIQKFISYKS